MPIRLPDLPPLAWTGEEGVADVDGDALRLVAAPGVDWTNDAAGGPQQHAATALAFDAPDGDFLLSARVEVLGDRTTFDAGALALWSDRDRWAKLCFEQSPQGVPMVVSVVTDVRSDDVNSAPVPDRSVHLRIARVGEAFAFHASADGRRWDLVRLFHLAAGPAPFRVGFLAQAPTGPSCTVRFDRIGYERRTLRDLRNGQ